MAQTCFLVDGAPQRGHMAASMLGVVLKGIDLVVVHFKLRGLKVDFPVIMTGIDVDFFDRGVRQINFRGIIGPCVKYGQIGRHRVTSEEERVIRGRIDDPYHRTGWVQVHDEVALILTTGYGIEPVVVQVA